MKNGFCVKYEARKPKKDGTTTNGSFVLENIDEVIRKRAELQRKGYKVSQVMQCLF